MTKEEMIELFKQNKELKLIAYQFQRDLSHEKKGILAENAMTFYFCKKCEQKELWTNTNAPSLCLSCSHDVVLETYLEWINAPEKPEVIEGFSNIAKRLSNDEVLIDPSGVMCDIKLVNDELRFWDPMLGKWVKHEGEVHTIFNKKWMVR